VKVVSAVDRAGRGPAARTVASALVGAVVVVLVVIALAPIDPASAQFAGRVAGVVVNGTDGASVPDGFEVALLTTDLDGKIVSQRTTPVDAIGAFEFTGVPEGDTVLNRLVTDYQGIISTIRLEEEIAPANLRVQIFESTRSLDTISIASEVLVARPDGPSRLIGFLEAITLRNDGDRTFVADLTDPNLSGLSMLRFGLPEGFQGFTGVSVDPHLPAGNILEAGPGFALTNPVPPGEYKLFFEYFVSYAGSEFGFTRNLPFGAGELRVLLPAGVATVSGRGLGPLKDVTLGPSVYSVMSGAGYERGASVELTFTRLPEPTTWQSLRTRARNADAYVKIGVPVAAGAILAGLLAYVFVVRSRRRPETSENRDLLVREIASLDGRFEQGEIEEAEYLSRRAELVQRALGQPDGHP
jgi:hypothetical protein